MLFLNLGNMNNYSTRFKNSIGQKISALQIRLERIWAHEVRCEAVKYKDVFHPNSSNYDRARYNIITYYKSIFP